MTEIFHSDMGLTGGVYGTAHVSWTGCACDKRRTYARLHLCVCLTAGLFASATRRFDSATCVAGRRPESDYLSVRVVRVESA